MATLARTPTKRNPWFVFLLPFLFEAIGTSVLGAPRTLAGNAICFLGILVWASSVDRMVAELNTVSKGNLRSWTLAIPFYNVYWLLVLLPREVARAKAIAGVTTPARATIVYVFLYLYALAADLNEIAARHAKA
jgi:hypothetical protein